MGSANKKKEKKRKRKKQRTKKDKKGKEKQERKENIPIKRKGGYVAIFCYFPFVGHSDVDPVAKIDVLVDMSILVYDMLNTIAPARRK